MNLKKLSYKQKPKQFSYQQKEINHKCTDDENDFDMINREKEAISNLCNSIAIQDSLEFLIDLTSNPKFIFYEELPSQIITVINEQLMKSEGANLIFIARCLKFIANIWKIPLLVEETLLDNVVSIFFQSITNLIELTNQEFLEIAIHSALSINNLIESTTKEGDKCFGVQNLDNLLFPQNPSRKSISMENLNLIISALDFDSGELALSVLQLILNITRVYKNEICPTIISSDNLASLLDFTDTQNLILLIICNLANDKGLNSTCFQSIFDSAFAKRFVDFAINVEEPDVVFKIYSVLSLYPANGLLKYLDNQDFWDSFKSRLIDLSQYDLTELMNLIEKILLIDEKFLDKYDFWPYIFEISDDFSAKNKEGFAVILINYFNQTVNFSTQNLDEPPLFFAVNGGFEFLCEILEFVQNPIIFYNISTCLSSLVITGKEVFGGIAQKIDLVSQLQQLREEYRLDAREHKSNDDDDVNDDEGNDDDEGNNGIGNNSIYSNSIGNNIIGNNSIGNNNIDDTINDDNDDNIESTITNLISIISHFSPSDENF